MNKDNEDDDNVVAEENMNEDEDNEDSSGTSKNTNEDGTMGNKASKDSATGENASEDSCTGNNASRVKSNNRGQGNVRYTPLTPSSSPANGLVLVPQQEICLVSNYLNI